MLVVEQALSDVNIDGCIQYFDGQIHVRFICNEVNCGGAVACKISFSCQVEKLADLSPGLVPRLGREYSS